MKPYSFIREKIGYDLSDYIFEKSGIEQVGSRRGVFTGSKTKSL